VLKIFCAGCLGLYPIISAQLTLKIAKNSLKPIFWGLRSFKIIEIDTPKNFVTNARYDKHHL